MTIFINILGRFKSFLFDFLESTTIVILTIT